MGNRFNSPAAHPLYLVGRLDLDPAEELLEEVEYGSRGLEELGQPRVGRHVLRQVGQQDGQVEPDLLGRVEEAPGKLAEVDVALVVRVTAQQQEVDLGTENVL